MLFSKSDTLEIISHLPKYLRDSKSGDVYTLMMIKNDWDFTWENSYIVRYAKENKKSISTVNFKVEVIGRQFEEAVYNMYLKVVELEKEGIINGKTWIGGLQDEVEADLPMNTQNEETQNERDLTTLFDGGTLFEDVKSKHT